MQKNRFKIVHEDDGKPYERNIPKLALQVLPWVIAGFFLLRWLIAIGKASRVVEM
jgi:hypothetical protein